MLAPQPGLPPGQNRRRQLPGPLDVARGREGLRPQGVGLLDHRVLLSQCDRVGADRGRGLRGLDRTRESQLDPRRQEPCRESVGVLRTERPLEDLPHRVRLPRRIGRPTLPQPQLGPRGPGPERVRMLRAEQLLLRRQDRRVDLLGSVRTSCLAVEIPEEAAGEQGPFPTALGLALGGHLPQQRLGLLVPGHPQESERQVVPRRPGVRMIRAEDPGPAFRDIAQERQRLADPPQPVEGRREVVLRPQGVRMVGALEPALPLESLAEELGRLGGPGACEEGRRQSVDRPQGDGMVGPEGPAADRDGLPVEPLGIVEPVHVPVEVGQVPHRPQRVGMLRPERRSPRTEDFEEEPLRLRVAPARAVPQDAEGLPDVHRLRGRGRGTPTEPERPIEVPLRLVEAPERRVGAPQCQPDLGLRGRGQGLAAKARRGGVEDLGHRDLSPLGAAGVDRREEIAEKPRDRRRPGRFLLGDGPYPFRLRPQSPLAEETDTEEDQHQRRGRRLDPVAAQELSEAVGEGARPRSDRLAGEVALEVAAELLGRPVAPLRLGGEGLRENRVEVAPQLAPAHRAPCLRGLTRPQHRTGRPQRLGPVGTVRGCRPAGGGRGAPRGLGRTAAGHQLVEQRPQTEDVRRRRHRRRGGLLGRRVGRCGPPVGGHGPDSGIRTVVEELGDAEVEELRPPRTIDEDVRRFEVPMDHEVPMQVADRLHHPEEESETTAEIELLGLGPGGDRKPVDPLKDEVGPPLAGQAPVEKAGDPRVVETGEQLAFGQEPRPQRRLLQVEVEELDRHAVLELTVGALGQVDRSHAAPAEEPDRPIGPDLDRRFERGVELADGTAADGRLEIGEPGVAGRSGGEELFDLPSQVFVARALPVQIGGPILDRKLGCGVEDPLGLRTRRRQPHCASASCRPSSR